MCIQHACYRNDRFPHLGSRGSFLNYLHYLGATHDDQISSEKVLVSGGDMLIAFGVNMPIPNRIFWKHSAQ
jgi:hypothetical protein